eukprot:CAMPEP_0172530494 /NCGR_PEP_ID=MMETSP1067-20121228/4214_1 /TAXON_ID=265564 ORGANISM="Thalassiosira punctigera, Strain Tpunct2005C2" /NCGR_SAMPLE_ID=MMETSP1067 /ASSEMBLY_ACC=CAM_ASM_000444 /LENGTH=223 /DNA_ID=CAMNT_0013314713 /DNA_START=107 /DNA_END=779 /DNA_ORIENTATION=-
MAATPPAPRPAPSRDAPSIASRYMVAPAPTPAALAVHAYRPTATAHSALGAAVLVELACAGAAPYFRAGVAGRRCRALGRRSTAPRSFRSHSGGATIVPMRTRPALHSGTTFVLSWRRRRWRRRLALHSGATIVSSWRRVRRGRRSTKRIRPALHRRWRRRLALHSVATIVSSWRREAALHQADTAGRTAIGAKYRGHREPEVIETGLKIVEKQKGYTAYITT